MKAYSESSGKSYDSWEELVEAEANGYVVVGTSERPDTHPMVVGPYPDKAECKKAQVRLRRNWKREEHPHKIKTYVRILWKERP